MTIIEQWYKLIVHSRGTVTDSVVQWTASRCILFGLACIGVTLMLIVGLMVSTVFILVIVYQLLWPIKRESDTQAHDITKYIKRIRAGRD